MKWRDAIKQSPVDAASRLTTDGCDREGREPNILLMDAKHRPPLPKAFRAVENYAWERRPFRDAKKLEDWEPAQHRFVPDLPESGVTV